MRAAVERDQKNKYNGSFGTHAEHMTHRKTDTSEPEIHSSIKSL